MKKLTLAVLLSAAFLSSTVSAQTEFKLLPGDGQENGLFGLSVAIDGDYAAVGAAYDDNEKGVDAGAVYIFKNQDNAWIQQTKLLASDGVAEDFFGYAVDMDSGYVVVGACWDDDAGEKSGSAYIFRFDGDTWTEEAKLTASDAGEDDRFGIDVAMCGVDVIVGAFFDDDLGDRAGSAYVFSKAGGTWVQQSKLLANDGAAGDWVGVEVSITKDYAAAGSRYNDNVNGADAGAVYVFKRDGTTWSQQAKLIASDGAEGDLFEKCAIDGSYLVVGSYHDDDIGANAGSVYVFHRDGTDWIEQEKLLASDGAEYDNFGNSIAIDKDRIVIGAYLNDQLATDAGAVYIFKRIKAQWTQVAKYVTSDGVEEDEFGKPVAVDGDYFIGGASKDDDNGSSSGSAYVFGPHIIRVPDDFPTIGEAMDNALPGDKVLVVPGMYPESINMTSNVILESEAGPTETIISLNNVDQLINGAADAVIRGFTISGNDNGVGRAGNGIYSNGDNVTVCNCIIRDNTAGIYCNNSSNAMIYNNTIDNNQQVGIYMQIDPTPSIFNNIITNHGTAGIERNTAVSPGDPFIQYNCYNGNTENYGFYGSEWTPTPGTGELFSDPQFVGGSPVDYHLASGSPCLDTGDPLWPDDEDGTHSDIGALGYGEATGVEKVTGSTVPAEFLLYPAYPNPFNPGTTIAFSHPQTTALSVTIFNIKGEEIKRISLGSRSAGVSSIQWDGRDELGNQVSSGVYVYRLEANSASSSFTNARKMILTK